MEVKIGVQHAARELMIETEQPAEEVEKLVGDALASGGVLSLVDIKHRRFIVPVDKLAYVEIGSGVIGQVGFRS